MVKETATNSIAVKSGGSIDMKLLTLSDPSLFGPFMTRGVADLPQAFSWTPGGGNLLKNKFN